MEDPITIEKMLDNRNKYIASTRNLKKKIKKVQGDTEYMKYRLCRRQARPIDRAHRNHRHHLTHQGTNSEGERERERERKRERERERERERRERAKNIKDR